METFPRTSLFDILICNFVWMYGSKLSACYVHRQISVIYWTEMVTMKVTSSTLLLLLPILLPLPHALHWAEAEDQQENHHLDHQDVDHLHHVVHCDGQELPQLILNDSFGSRKEIPFHVSNCLFTKIPGSSTPKESQMLTLQFGPGPPPYIYWERNGLTRRNLMLTPCGSGEDCSLGPTFCLLRINQPTYPSAGCFSYFLFISNTSSQFKSYKGFIPHICHFCYTGKIFGAKILHPKVRKLKQIGFRDKIA